MCITKKILDWTEEKYEDVVENEDSMVKACAKSFGIGAIEGAIDGAVIVGLTCATIGLVNIVKAIVTKE